MGVKALFLSLIGRPQVSPLKKLGDPKERANITFTKPGESRTVTIPDQAGVNIATHYEQVLHRYSCARIGNMITLMKEGNPHAAFQGRQVVLIEGREQRLGDLSALRQGDIVTITFLPECERRPAAPPLPAVAPGLRTSDGCPTEIMVVPAELQMPIGLNGKPVDGNNYVEIVGAEELKHGDILPGVSFVLGQPETYFREVDRSDIRDELGQSEVKTKTIVDSGMFFNPNDEELIVAKTKEECGKTIDHLIRRGILSEVDKINLMPYFQGRELLTMNLGEGSELFGLRQQAHRIVREVSRDTTIKNKQLETATRIYQMVNDSFLAKTSGGEGGRLMTVGWFIKKGGNCRHRSAALVKVLQEVGLRARFAKGFPTGGGRHGWIEFDLDDNGKYENIYVFDLMFKRHGRATTVEDPTRIIPTFKGDKAYDVAGKLYFRDEAGTRVWREIEPGSNGRRAGLTIMGMAIAVSPLLNK